MFGPITNGIFAAAQAHAAARSSQHQNQGISPSRKRAADVQPGGLHLLQCPLQGKHAVARPAAGWRDHFANQANIHQGTGNRVRDQRVRERPPTAVGGGETAKKPLAASQPIARIVQNILSYTPGKMFASSNRTGGSLGSAVAGWIANRPQFSYPLGPAQDKCRPPAHG